MYQPFNPDQAMGLMDFVKAARSVITECSPEEIKAKLDQGEDLLVVDVRETSEHEQGHLPGARLVPRGILEAAADPAFSSHSPDLANARDKTVVVYCATGGRSAMAAAVLQMMGYRKVLSLAGGFSSWRDAKLPIVQEARYA